MEEAHIKNQGVIDIIAEIDEAGAATHDEWYIDLRHHVSTLDKWYDHVVSNNASNNDIRQGLMDNTIPSTCVNSGTTSNDRKYGNGLKPTGRPSTKIFKDTTGHMTKATNTATMDHKLREPACTFNMEPVIVINLLASTSKFCDVKYITLFDKEEVNVYDAGTTTVTTSNPPIIKGWWDVVRTLWSIPLVK